MATYTYRCKDCAARIEVQAPMCEGPRAPVACLNCMSLNIVRVFNAASIRFVGGGWGCKS